MRIQKLWRTGIHVRVNSIKQFQSQYSKIASHNISADPLFVDPENRDFRLKPGSPCIDAGGPLTKTRTPGKGREIEVEDALFFCDGYDIVAPDIIRIAHKRVRIVRIDYETNTTTIDRDLTWPAYTPVSLDYEGRAPDMGGVSLKRGRFCQTLYIL